MEWMWLLTAGLAIAVTALLLKLYFLKKSAREIRAGFAEKTKQVTNTPIVISGHDRDMRALAADINAQLLLLNESRQKFEHGDLELKEALTNISHDLRTPLTAVCGYLKLLENEECTEAARTYLLAIENRTQALTQLTEELFRYTMAVSDTEELPLSPLSLNGVLENCIVSYYAVLTEKGIVPQISMPEKQVVCLANENALLRVLGNIIGNAVKYSDGDLHVTLTESGRLLFANRASALTEVQVGRLFDRFYTVNSAGKSTGLGLSIARALTERMGGVITASYEKGVLTICVELREAEI